MIKLLSVAEIEYVTFRLAKELMAFNEPIPDFTTRYPNILESCLAAPFQQFGGKVLYQGIIGRAAVLFYLLIKNHPFKNGNKRIAITTLFYFLHKNKKWLQVDNQELYNFAVWVAQSNPKLKTDTVRAIETFLNSCLVKLK
jgi:death-on-curing family protein